MARAQHPSKSKRILNLPFEIDPNEIITAAYVTARFLSKKLETEVLFWLSTRRIQQGIESVDEVTREHQINAVYGAVVVGLDGNLITIQSLKLSKYSKIIPAALMIGCNLMQMYVGDGGKFTGNWLSQYKQSHMQLEGILS